MIKIVEKLIRKEIEISKDKGQFSLFALFLREDSPNKWDLLVAAPWIEKNKNLALKHIASIIQKTLTQEELIKISRIIIIDCNNKALNAIQRAFSAEHGMTEIVNSNFFGLNIKHAYIITSKKHITKQSS